jgi:hypothetical protein
VSECENKENGFPVCPRITELEAERDKLLELLEEAQQALSGWDDLLHEKIKAALEEKQVEDYPPCFYCGERQCDCDTL